MKQLIGGWTQGSGSRDALPKKKKNPCTFFSFDYSRNKIFGSFAFWKPSRTWITLKRWPAKFGAPMPNFHLDLALCYIPKYLHDYTNNIHIRKSKFQVKIYICSANVRHPKYGKSLNSISHLTWYSHKKCSVHGMLSNVPYNYISSYIKAARLILKIFRIED